MTPDFGWQLESSEDLSHVSPQLLIEQLYQYKGLIEDLLALALSLSITDDLRTFLESVLGTARKMTRSDAGSIYLIDRTAPVHTVCFEVSQNSSQPDRSLVNFAVPLNQDSIVGYVALTGETLNLSDAHDLPEDASYCHHKTFDYDIEYHTRSVLAVPMFDSQKRTIGVFQLINRKVQDISITKENVQEITLAYSAFDEKLLRSIASQVSLYIERSQLLGQVFKA
ncbi:GAF domain-containing protein [Pseudanabaena sp. ABRG5-3]|uniref:GAF domain-containing protein n=1 Tax=Pseudanabaena sp. ABRG5-3 TaxID=685565 RepID=UPI000DC730A0|nr:GAF domain-containing protein [Pseudanabaena sp. ABRG5-3]BBC26565.1 metal dependent phosphohydrolase [Pseudanabaena sp. ABRG5-3]